MSITAHSSENEMKRNEEDMKTKNTTSIMYILNIELQKGITKQLKIYSDSNSAELAYYFCKENDLDFSSLSQWTVQIETWIQKFANDNQENSEENADMIYKYNRVQMSTIPEEKYNNQINQIATKDKIKHKEESKEKHKKEDNKKEKEIKPQWNLLRIDTKMKNKSNNINSHDNTQKQTTRSHDNKYGIPSLNKISTASFKINQSISTIPSNQHTNRTKIITRQSSGIFNRLYTDAKLKRMLSARPCHFSNSPNKQVTPVQSKKTYYYQSSSNNSARNIFALNKSKSTIFSQARQGSMIDITSNSNQNGNNDTITNKDSQKWKSPKVSIEKSQKKTNIIHRTINTNSSLSQYNFNNNSISPLSSPRGHTFHYIPLKKRGNILFHTTSSVEDVLLEGIRNKSFTNLFFDWIGGKDKTEWKKDTLSLKSIDTNVLNHIKKIISNLTTSNAILTKDDFIREMKALFDSDLTMEQKRTIISIYKNKF